MRIAIQQVVEKGNQRRTLSAGSHISRPKIGYNRDTYPSGDDSAFSSLPRHGEFPSKKRLTLALVIESLSVAAHQFHLETMLLLGS